MVNVFRSAPNLFIALHTKRHPDGVHFLPGANQIHDQDWSEIKDTLHVQRELNDGRMSLERKEFVKQVSPPQGSASQSNEILEELSKLSEEDAIEALADVEDLKLLELIAVAETRAAVKVAAASRVKKGLTVGDGVDPS